MLPKVLSVTGGLPGAGQHPGPAAQHVALAAGGVGGGQAAGVAVGGGRGAAVAALVQSAAPTGQRGSC